jgi:hypothetical protein
MTSMSPLLQLVLKLSFGQGPPSTPQSMSTASSMPPDRRKSIEVALGVNFAPSSLPAFDASVDQRVGGPLRDLRGRAEQAGMRFRFAVVFPGVPPQQEGLGERLGASLAQLRAQLGFAPDLPAPGVEQVLASAASLQWSFATQAAVRLVLVLTDGVEPDAADFGLDRNHNLRDAARTIAEAGICMGVIFTGGGEFHRRAELEEAFDGNAGALSWENLEVPDGSPSEWNAAELELYEVSLEAAVERQLRRFG